MWQKAFGRCGRRREWQKAGWQRDGSCVALQHTRHNTTQQLTTQQLTTQQLTTQDITIHQYTTHGTNKKFHPPPRLPLLQEFFGVSKTQASRIADSDERLKECSTYVLAHNMNTIKVNGVDPGEVRGHLELLYFCPLTVEHRVAILRDLRLKGLAATHYRNFSKLYKAPLGFLKVHGLLPEDYDAKWDVLAPLGVPDEVIDSTDVHANDAAVLGQVYEQLSAAWLRWRLDVSERHVAGVRHTYPATRTKSVSLMDQVLTSLDHHWGFDRDKVLRHGFLLSLSPTNLDLIRTQVVDVCGAGVVEVARLAPRVLNVPHHQLLQTSDLLTSVGVQARAVVSLPQVCTLSPDTIQQRLHALSHVPEFEALRTHPRMVRLVYYNKKVKSRLSLLQQLKDAKGIPSLNIISGHTGQFHRYLTLGDLKQNKRDVITFLAHAFGVKGSVIRGSLRVPAGQSSVSGVKANLTALLDHGFTKAQLLGALEVLLYPPDLLTQQLTRLEHRAELQPFTTYRLTPQALQLLLYYMDKNNYYAGQ